MCDSGTDTIKHRYIKLSQMGVTVTCDLETALDEIRTAHENALLTDDMRVNFIELTETEYEALPEFEGY